MTKLLMKTLWNGSAGHCESTRINRRVNKRSKVENKQINELAASLKQYSIDCRRKVHRFAEVAAHEVKTSAFIQQEIRAFGAPL